MVSLGIFCYQINVALDNLMSKATVDSTEYIPISDLNSPPIITFCPKQAENRILLFKWGYFGSMSKSTCAPGLRYQTCCWCWDFDS